MEGHFKNALRTVQPKGISMNLTARIAGACLAAATLAWPFSSLATLGDYQNAVTNEPGILSHYTFDLTNANDSFGPNNGTIQGTVAFGAGIGGSGRAMTV